jgi:Hypothetical glycosyl hydrolase family 15
MSHTARKLYAFRTAALAVLAAFLFAAIGDQQAGRAAASSVQGIPGIGAWRISSHDTDLGEQTLQLGRYSVVVMNAWQAAPGSSSYLSPAQIHADNPATKVAMYADGPGVQSDCTTLAETQTTCGTGIGMYDVNNGHPDWLLRDSSGNPITFAGYPWMYVGDFGSNTFRQQWVSNVVYRAKTLGFDGVSIDDILSSFSGLTGGVVPAKYPTQNAWDQAMLGFIQFVSSALRAQGLYVGAEVFGWNDAGGSSNNDGSADAAWWQQVAPSLNAIFCEYFEQNPNNLAQSYDNAHQNWTGNWDGWLKLIDVAQSAGADFWGLDYSTDTTADQRIMTYGKASFLLKWNGSPTGVFFWQNGRDAVSGTNPWDPNWTMDIGTPVSAMYSVGTGGFRRDYTAGIVIVNPMQTTQTFDLGGTYTTQSGVSVTSVTLGPTTAAILHSTAAVLAPTNTSAPLITGTVQVGSQLTTSPGTWSGSLATYTYQWLRCGSSGGSCAAISGATNSTYLLTSADQAATIRSSVTASNSAGSAVAVSAQTAIVSALAVAPTNTGLPTISGTPQVGLQLTASTGGWSGSPTSYSYQWRRCDITGASCSAIKGANTSQYVLASADQGATVRVAVTAVNSSGSGIAVSVQTSVVMAATTTATAATVATPTTTTTTATKTTTIATTTTTTASPPLQSTAAPSAPVNTGLPEVSGTAQQVQTLTASTGAWSGNPTDYAYQWMSCDSSGASCAPIGGAVSSSYTVSHTDVGSTLRVVVIASNAVGSATATSAPTAVVSKPGKGN